MLGGHAPNLVLNIPLFMVLKFPLITHHSKRGKMMKQVYTMSTLVFSFPCLFFNAGYHLSTKWFLYAIYIYLGWILWFMNCSWFIRLGHYKSVSLLHGAGMYQHFLILFTPCYALITDSCWHTSNIVINVMWIDIIWYKQRTFLTKSPGTKGWRLIL